MAQEVAVFLDMVARLTVGAMAILKGHIGAPKQAVSSDVLDHALDRREDLSIWEVEGVAYSDRKAHFHTEVGVLERLKDGVWQVDGIAIDKRAIRESVRDARGCV